MLERLDFWLAVFTLGALAYFELRLHRFVGPVVRGILNVAGPAAVGHVKRRRARQLPTTVRLKSRPIRSSYGRFNGSLPAVPTRSSLRSEVERRSDQRPALESDGTNGTNVPGGTILPEEAALIGLRLGRGMSASDVAKSLPGYSARKYKEYREKVQTVENALADLEPAAVIQDAA